MARTRAPESQTSLSSINEVARDTSPLLSDSSETYEHGTLRDVDAPVERENVASASTMRVFMNVTKCFVGAASFELPWAFLQSGLLGGMIGILVLALLSSYTLVILARCSHLTDKAHPTYPDIGSEALPWFKLGRIIAWFGVIAMTLGVCGSYVVFIGSQMSQLLCGFSWFFTTYNCTLLITPVIVGLSWLRSYKFLAPTSVLGILALAFALVVTMVDGGVQEGVSSPIAENQPKLFEGSTYALFLGNAAFLYLIHSVVLPVHQSMKKPQKWAPVVLSSVGVVTVVNVIFATFALLYWGKQTQSIIIDNLRDGVVSIIVRVLLSLDLLFTTALFLFPVSEGLEVELFDPKTFGQFSIEVKRNALRTVLVLAISGIALGIPYFSVLTGLTGGFGNNILGFLLPPVFHFVLQHRRGYWQCVNLNDLRRFNKQSLMRLAELVLGGVIVVVSLFMMVLSTEACIKQIIIKSQQSSPFNFACEALLPFPNANATMAPTPVYPTPAV